jgi:hypothetical protein
MMKDDRDRREEQIPAPAKTPQQDKRQDRLKQALRENLKRRKTQARGRSDQTPISSTSAPSNGDEAAPYDGGGNKPDE